jgi:hypothetical protein
MAEVTLRRIGSARFHKFAYGARLKKMPAAKTDGKNGGKSCDKAA